MFTIKSNPARAVLTGLFWDPFDVARAITALIRDGFSEYEIDAIGVLCGRAPDLTDLLFSMGLERDETIFYNDCLPMELCCSSSARNQDAERGLR
jgi:hypothetical protein